MEKQTTSIRLPKECYEYLRKLSYETKKSINEHVVEAIRQYIKNIKEVA